MKEAYLIIYLLTCLGLGSVEAQSPLTDSITSVTNIVCGGYGTGSATVGVSGGIPPYTYSWQPGSDTSATDTGMYRNTYTVTVVDNVQDTAYAYVTITEPMPLSVSAKYVNNVTCRGYNNGSAGIMASGGVPPYTYLWMPGGDTTTADSNMPGGNYTVTVTDANSCTSSTQVTIGLVSDPSASITNTNNVSCFGNYNGTATGLVTGGIAPYTYFWTPGSDTTSTASGLGAGTYTLQTTDALGCSATSSVTILTPPRLILTAHAIDSTAAAVIASGGIPPYTYHWYPPVSTSSLATGLSAGVYTITVNDSNFCSDSARVEVVGGVTGTTLYLSLANDSVICGNPSYFSFDVMVQADSAKRLNDCQFVFIYPGSEFGAGASIEPGPNFQHDTGANDYQIAITPYYYAPDSGLIVDFGSSGYTSYRGTIVDNTPQVLLHISLRITNSCHTGTIHFADTGYYAYQNHFVSEDSSYSYLDSTKLSYTTCCRYHCGDTLGPNYLCGEYCCAFDSSAHCIDSCWDTCNTYPVYCYDTTWTYSYDSIFNYSHYHNIQYSITYYSNGIPTASCPPVITNFNDTIRAGIHDTLTISGANFGNTRGTGQVKFHDADTANYYIQRLNDADYMSWTNNEIKILLPSFADTVLGSYPQKELTIGGNKFWVVNSCNDSAASGNNILGNPFSIYYNLSDFWDEHVIAQKTELLLRSTDTSGGYVIRFDSVTFPEGSNKRAIFYKAMRDWTCYTGMNWIVGKDTSFNYRLGQFYGINYVSFTSQLSPNQAAETYPDPDECNNYTDILEQGNISFNSDTTYIRFIYDTTELVDIPPRQFDFYGVCLHELGHFIGLDHDVISTHLMYYNDNQGPITASHRITLATAAAGSAIDGAFYSVHQGENIPSTCSSLYTPMSGKGTSCVNDYTGIKQIISQNNPNFTVYPNPSNGAFTIDANVNNYTLIVMNMLGQVILSRKINEEKTIVSLANMANGMYFLQEQYKNGISSQKINITKK